MDPHEVETWARTKTMRTLLQRARRRSDRAGQRRETVAGDQQHHNPNTPPRPRPP